MEMDVKAASGGRLEKEYAKLENFFYVWPSDFIRDDAAAAAGIAIKHALPVLKSPHYGFKDRSGNLRKSIRTRQRRGRGFGKRRGKSNLSLAYALAGGKRAHYALWVHQGHGGPVKAAPHPFLTEGLRDTRNSIFDTFVDVLGKKYPLNARIIARELGIPAFTKVPY